MPAFAVIPSKGAYMSLKTELVIVNALSTQLSWTHIRELAGISDNLKRVFYTELGVREKWSTRILLERIGSMLYERTALSKNPKNLSGRNLICLKRKVPLHPTWYSATLTF